MGRIAVASRADEAAWRSTITLTVFDFLLVSKADCNQRFAPFSQPKCIRRCHLPPPSVPNDFESTSARNRFTRVSTKILVFKTKHFRGLRQSKLTESDFQPLQARNRSQE